MSSPDCEGVWCCENGPLTHGGLVVPRPFIAQLTAVFLCSDGGGQVDGDHLEQGLPSRQPTPHHSLQQGLPLFLLVLRVEFHIQLLNQFGCLVLLEIHDGIKNLDSEKGQNDDIKPPPKAIAL